MAERPSGCTFKGQFLRKNAASPAALKAKISGIFEHCFLMSRSGSRLKVDDAIPKGFRA
jgi:hypothetical protein